MQNIAHQGGLCCHGLLNYLDPLFVLDNQQLEVISSRALLAA